MYVLTGKYGKQPGIIRPFEHLTINQLKEELRARKIYDFGSTKADTRQSLNEALRGVQRVPSLLLSSPTKNIQTLNLQNYTILECEPLHDHLCNVFEILPTILEKELAASCKTILDIDLFKKDTKRGADCRLTAIHLLSLLSRSPSTPYKVLQLTLYRPYVNCVIYSRDRKISAARERCCLCRYITKSVDLSLVQVYTKRQLVWCPMSSEVQSTGREDGGSARWTTQTTVSINLGALYMAVRE